MENIYKEYIFNIKGALKYHWDKWGRNVDGENRVSQTSSDVDTSVVVIKYTSFIYEIGKHILKSNNTKKDILYTI